MDGLQERIRKLIKHWNGEYVNVTIPNGLKQLIRYTYYHDKLMDVKEWRKYFKVVYGDPTRLYGGCFCDAMKKGKFLGKGRYGEVFSTKYPCAKYGRVAVKIEEIKIELIDDESIHKKQLPHHVHSYVEIANKMSKLEITPHIFDTFICITGDKMKIIKVMQLAQGKPLKNIMWKSDNHYKDAIQKVKKIVKVMNQHGVMHNDLNFGNIMVTLKDGYADKISIIDFDGASETIESDTLDKEYEENRLNKMSDYVGLQILKESNWMKPN